MSTPDRATGSQARLPRVGIALAVAVALLVALLATDRLDGRTASNAVAERSAAQLQLVSQTTTRDPNARCSPTRDVNPTCKPSYWRKKFNKGELGHTRHGHSIPKRIKRMLKKEYRQQNRGVSARGADDWLDHMLSSVACMGGGWQVGCASVDEVSPDGSFPWKRVAAVSIICGQAAWNATMTRGVHADPRIIAVRAAGGCLGAAAVSIWGGD